MDDSNQIAASFDAACTAEDACAHSDHLDAEFHHHHSHASVSHHPGHHHLLTIEDLTVSFDRYDDAASFWRAGRARQEVLHGLTLSVHEGEILAVVGASGSGKTVLADALLGLYEPNAEVTGRIWFDGELQDADGLAALRGQCIALVPQSVSHLDPLMRVGKQVQGQARGYTREARAANRARRAVLQRELFESYGLDAEVAQMRPHQLSGGMARRVLLMCALMEHPRLLIADEPTPGLDLELAVHALDDLRAFADTGGGVMLITHDLELALRVADRVAVFKDGTVVEETAVASFREPEGLRTPFARALANELVAPCGFGSPEGVHDDSRVLLSCRDLTFAYDGSQELYGDFSLDIRAGERVALSAPSGAGKTTLCQLLAGYLVPAGGTVEVAGASLAEWKKHGTPLPVQLIAQHPERAFDPRMRMRVSLAEAGSLESPRASMLLARFDIRDAWLGRMPHELSGGELMRFCLVRALMTRPRVLICDESTAMLDLVTQAELWRVICELQAQERFAVVFVSHAPALVRRLATRVVRL